MQVYLPGAGWVDFDPTNGIIGNRNLIRVAVAWDPKQVLPLWGTYVGSRFRFPGDGCFGQRDARDAELKPNESFGPRARADS